MLLINTNGLWETKFNPTFFEVLIFDANARSSPRTINESFDTHESQKQLKCEQRKVEIENNSFNHLRFATAGGAAPAAFKVKTRL